MTDFPEIVKIDGQFPAICTRAMKRVQKTGDKLPYVFTVWELENTGEAAPPEVLVSLSPFWFQDIMRSCLKSIGFMDSEGNMRKELRGASGSPRSWDEEMVAANIEGCRALLTVKTKGERIEAKGFEPLLEDGLPVTQPDIKPIPKPGLPEDDESEQPFPDEDEEEFV